MGHIFGWLRVRRLSCARKQSRSPARRRAGTKGAGVRGALELLEQRSLLSYSAALLDGTVTFTGDLDGDTLTFDLDDGGNLRHNRASDSGFESAIDLDSETEGVQ